MPEESTTPDLEDGTRQFVEASNRRDFDAALAPFSKGAVWDRSRVGQEVIEGREAIRGFFMDWLAPYEDYKQELEEFRDLGSGVSFAVLKQRGRLAGSVRNPAPVAP